MNLQTATTHGQASWLFESDGPQWRPSVARGKSAPLLVLVASSEVEERTSLGQHLASLPTLRDLAGSFRAEDPGFDSKLERARRRRYRELLKEVAAGRLNRVVAERLTRGWTQADLAARAGMKQPNVARLERVGASVSVKSAKRLADAFGIADYRELLP
jgi:ribosome-binding protein aMBF1 (putative translation factor)